MRQKDGTYRWIWSIGKVSRTDKHERSLQFTGVHRDISEKKKMDEELVKHREKLEELVKQRTAELEEKNIFLERMNRAMIDREFRVKELKDELTKL